MTILRRPRAEAKQDTRIRGSPTKTHLGFYSFLFSWFKLSCFSLLALFSALTQPPLLFPPCQLLVFGDLL